MQIVDRVGQSSKEDLQVPFRYITGIETPIRSIARAVRRFDRYRFAADVPDQSFRRLWELGQRYVEAGVNYFADPVRLERGPKLRPLILHGDPSLALDEFPAVVFQDFGDDHVSRTTKIELRHCHSSVTRSRGLTLATAADPCLGLRDG
jgi:hypothetical protein